MNRKLLVMQQFNQQQSVEAIGNNEETEAEEVNIKAAV